MSNQSRLSKSSVVFRYYLYQATARPGFHYPVYTLFLLWNGLSFAQIGLIATIQSIVVVTSEIPTGYVGDRIGRRNSLVVGAFLMLISNASYLVATDFIGFTFTFVMLSFGGTFVSGSGNAWLYDTLKEHDIEDEFTRIKGRSRAIAQWVSAGSLVAGGFLYSMNRFYPFYAGLVVALLSLVMVFRLPQNRAYDAEESTESETMTIVDAIPVIRDQLTAPSLRSFIVYLALFSGAILTMDMWIQPIAQSSLEASFGPTLEGWGLSEPAIIGLLYAAFTVVSAVMSDYAGDIEDLLGVSRAMFLIPVSIAIMYVFAEFVPLLAFPMFFMMKGGNSVVSPIYQRYINDQVQSVGRATLLSSVAMLRSIAGIPFRVGSGILATWYSTSGAVAILGAVFIVGAVLIFTFAPPVSAEYSSTSTATASD
ncbi:MFS transporter [Halostella pelagica]|uniref:MFS transporter n=1 Tax=Halostella pelagica TaxID=2583824 RepID=UPI0010802DC5|nr:MFS transporter [Halostella pelagica]